MPATIPVPAEDEEQRALMQWAALAATQTPALRLLFHIPNGGARHPVVGAKLKALGVKAGFPDLGLPVARGGYHGLYVELKRRGGGTTGATQTAWHAALLAEGYAVEVCHGWLAARTCLLRYLALPKVSSRQAGGANGHHPRCAGPPRQVGGLPDRAAPLGQLRGRRRGPMFG